MRLRGVAVPCMGRALSSSALAVLSFFLFCVKENLVASRARYRKIISSGPVVISSSSGTLRGPEGACEPDFSNSVPGRPAIAVHSVGSRTRLLGPFRVADSFSNIFLPRSGWSGVAFELRRRGHRRRSMVFGASEPRRQRGCDSRVSDRLFPAPESSASARHQFGNPGGASATFPRGGVVFGQRKRGGAGVVHSGRAVEACELLIKTGGACGRSPSRAQKRTGRPTPSLQRTPSAISGYNGLRAGFASRSFGSLRRGAR